ncbi:PapD-like protein [Dichotomocladium elegans]|nr:PapD-like protein [Dichotomocladium elegans]
MSLRIYPSDFVHFERPLTRLIEQEISLENVDKQPLLFKVKTTSPKYFWVRPNVGYIKPLSTAKVKLFRQPMKEEPALDTQFDDKFLILSIPCGSEKPPLPEDLLKMWSTIEKTEKGRISRNKIRCSYVQSPPQPPPATPVQQATTPPPQPPNYAISQSTTVHHKPQQSPSPDEAPPSSSVIAETSHQLAEIQRMLDSYRQDISELRHRDPEVDRERREEGTEAWVKDTVATQPQMRTPVKKIHVQQTGYSIREIVLVAVIAFALGCLLFALHK